MGDFCLPGASYPTLLYIHSKTPGSTCSGKGCIRDGPNSGSNAAQNLVNFLQFWQIMRSDCKLQIGTIGTHFFYYDRHYKICDRRNTLSTSGVWSRPLVQTSPSPIARATMFSISQTRWWTRRMSMSVIQVTSAYWRRTAMLCRSRLLLDTSKLSVTILVLLKHSASLLPWIGLRWPKFLVDLWPNWPHSSQYDLE